MIYISTFDRWFILLDRVKQFIGTVYFWMLDHTQVKKSEVARSKKHFSGRSIETFQREYVAVSRQSSLLTIAASKSRWRRFCGPSNAHGKMVMRSQQKLLLLRRFYCRGYDSSGAVYRLRGVNVNDKKKGNWKMTFPVYTPPVAPFIVANELLLNCCTFLFPWILTLQFDFFFFFVY